MFPSPLSRLVDFARPSRAWLAVSLAVSGILAPPPVRAQTPSPKAAPPAPPTLVGPAWKKPEFPSSWKVQVSNLSTQAGVPLAKGSTEAIPSSYSIHSSKDLTIARFQYPGGQSKETWIFPLRSFVQIGSGEPSLAPSVGGEEEGWASLQELAWIRPDLYLGEFPLEGETCLVFAILPAPPAAPAPPAGQGSQGSQGSQGVPRPPGPQTAPASASARAAKAAPQGPIAGLPLQAGVQAAAISERTRMPKLLQEGVLIRKYEFVSTSKEDFVVPEKISKLNALWAPKKPLPIRTP